MDRLARALVQRGHTLHCASFSPRPGDANYEVLRLEPPAGGRILQKFAAGRVFRRISIEGYDVAHYHGDDYLCRGSRRRIRTFYGSALAEAVHAATVGRFFYQAVFYLLEWISCLRKGKKAGISRATARVLPCAKRVVPCGVPLERYYPQGRKTQYPSILFLGDLHSRKRGALMLEVFRTSVLPRHPSCRLTVVGPQPCEGRNVRYLGQIDEEELIQEYRRSWIYCMPSSYEGFGVPAIEAMACATPVIAVRNPGVLEIIDSGIDGLLCHTEELGSALSRVLSDSVLREKLARGGLEKVKRCFSMQTIAEQYELLYHTMVASS